MNRQTQGASDGPSLVTKKKERTMQGVTEKR